MAKLPLDRIALAAILALPLLGGACGDKDGDDTAGDGGTEDGGASDGGASDGGSSDGGASDGGASDGGSSDGGSSDGGSSDGGSSDGGSSDGGSSDGGSSDGGSSDGGSSDGGSTDGGSSDGGSTDGGSSDGGSADGGASEGDVLTTGEWDITRSRATKDPCGFSDGSVETETMLLEYVDKAHTRFELTAGPDEEVRYACDLSGATFSCDESESRGSEGSMTFVAVEQLTGSFPDDATLAGVVRTEISCEGAGCGDIGVSFPCIIEQDVDGEWLRKR